MPRLTPAVLLASAILVAPTLHAETVDLLRDLAVSGKVDVSAFASAADQPPPDFEVFTEEESDRDAASASSFAEFPLAVSVRVETDRVGAVGSGDASLTAPRESNRIQAALGVAGSGGFFQAPPLQTSGSGSGRAFFVYDFAVDEDAAFELTFIDENTSSIGTGTYEAA